MRSNGSGVTPSGWMCNRLHRVVKIRPPSAGAASRAAVAAGRGLDSLLAVLLAPTCPLCRTLLDRPTQGLICPACWNAVPRLTPPVCDRCSDPLPSWRVISTQCARCPRCRRTTSALERGRAVGPYENTLRQLVHLFKYERRHTLAAPLGALMRRYGADLLADADCVIPVPLHPRRQRARGFNQAAELAAHLGPPVVHALRRTIATPPQTGLPAARRHRNVRGVFAPARTRPWWTGCGRWGTRSVAVQGACVVLVDDVATTGATLEACARELRRCGVREVRALTLARAVRRE